MGDRVVQLGLTFYSKIATAEALTAALGRQPTRSGEKGSEGPMEGVPLPAAFWTLKAPELLPLSEQAQWLDSELDKVARAVEHAAASGWEPRLRLVWSSSGITGPVLEAELLERLSRWSLALELVHYDHPSS